MTQRDSTQDDDELFAKALQEVESPNRDAGLWAKAFAKSEGDIQRAKAFYIRERVNRLVASGAPTHVAAHITDRVQRASKVLVVGYLALTGAGLGYLLLVGTLSRIPGAAEPIVWSLVAAAIGYLLVDGFATKLQEGKNWARWTVIVLLSLSVVRAVSTVGMGAFALSSLAASGWANDTSIALFLVMLAHGIANLGWAGYVVFALLGKEAGVFFTQPRNSPHPIS